MTKHRYRSLRVNEVSFVDKGASPGARVSFWKRDGEVVAPEKPMDMDAILAKLTPDEQAFLLKTLEAAKAAPPPEKKADEAPAADVLKSLPESVRKQLADDAAALRETRERVAKMEAENETRVYVEKAASFPYVPGLCRADLGEVLKAADLGRPISKELGAKLEKSLRAINEAVSKGKLFEEQGTGGNGSDGSIEAIAKSYRAADPKLTQAQAITKALKENPDLYVRENSPVRG